MEVSKNSVGKTVDGLVVTLTVHLRAFLDLLLTCEFVSHAIEYFDLMFS